MAKNAKYKLMNIHMYPLPRFVLKCTSCVKNRRHNVVSAQISFRGRQSLLFFISKARSVKFTIWLRFIIKLFTEGPIILNGQRAQKDFTLRNTHY